MWPGLIGLLWSPSLSYLDGWECVLLIDGVVCVCVCVCLYGMWWVDFISIDIYSDRKNVRIPLGSRWNSLLSFVVVVFCCCCMCRQIRITYFLMYICMLRFSCVWEWSRPYSNPRWDTWELDLLAHIISIGFDVWLCVYFFCVRTFWALKWTHPLLPAGTDGAWLWWFCYKASPLHAL